MSGGFGLWAESYDDEPNALLRLGDRVLEERLGDVGGLRVLDAGCGTGRWMGRIGRAVGLDAERAMLLRAPRGRAAVADLTCPPFREGAFDLAIAAFSLSYAASPRAALSAVCSLIAPGGRVAVVDLHPDAVEAGWRRTFRHAERTVEVPSRVQELDAALIKPRVGWRVEALDSARFGVAERDSFSNERWERVRKVWAVRCAVLVRE